MERLGCRVRGWWVNTILTNISQNFIKFGESMRNTDTNPAETLANIQSKVELYAHTSGTNPHINRKLRREISNANARENEKAQKDSFGSSWLPGPLSYPWLLMFAGVPKVLEHLLRNG